MSWSLGFWKSGRQAEEGASGPGGCKAEIAMHSPHLPALGDDVAVDHLAVDSKEQQQLVEGGQG
jgi:hypothetical protein